MIKRIAATEAVHLAKVGYAFIDVRPPDDYRTGHPTRAINVPHGFYTPSGGFKPNPDFLKVMEALFPKKSKLLLVGRVGARSLAAAQELEAAGYEEITDLRAGYKGILNAKGGYDEPGWLTLGLPTEEHTDGGSYEEILRKAKLA